MRKKLFAVIMSAMMMITFMPTMAFAAVGWNTDHTAYTPSEGATPYTNVVKYIKVTGGDTDGWTGWDGKIYVGAYDDNDAFVVASEAELGYDLSNAYASKVNGTTNSWGKKKENFNYSEAMTVFHLTGPQTLEGLSTQVNVNEITMEVPSYIAKVRNGSAPTLSKIGDGANTKAITAGTDFTVGDFKITTPKNYDAEKQFTEDQEFTLVVTTNKDKTTLGTAVNYVDNQVKTRTMKFAKVAADVKNASYTIDGENTASAYYNGAAHKISQNVLEGITSSYELLNNKTGKYEVVSGDAVEVKNVATYIIKATAKDAKGNKNVKILSFEVKPSCTATVEFKKPLFYVAGKFDAKAKEYLNVSFDNASNSKAAKKAVAADEAALMEYFNEAYDVTVEDKDNGLKLATIDSKDMTSAEKKALDKKYEELLGNYGTNSNPAFMAYDTAEFKVVDDIKFTKAPLTKTYKAKKGKLPKNKTFKVKAKAASGSTLVYKVTKGAGKIVVNRNTGKITVKKGLKKGTYKVGVYAVTLDTFDGPQEDWVQDHYTLKIRVK